MLKETKQLFKFGDFEFDLEKRLLWRHGSLVSLAPKLADTLLTLVRSAGDVVDKHELVSKVWPDTTVEENSLSQNISALRKILGFSPDGHQYIETVAKRGYRFIPTAAVLDREQTISSGEGLEAAHAVFVTEGDSGRDASRGELASVNPESPMSGISDIIAERGQPPKPKLAGIVAVGIVIIALVVGYLIGRSRQISFSSYVHSADALPSPPPKMTEYEFEDGEQGWLVRPNMMIMRVARSSEHSFKGQHSLAIYFNGPYARRSQIYVASPNIRTGMMVKAHVWCPVKSHLVAIALFIEDRDGSWNNDWRSISNFVPGSWNNFYLQVPTDAATPISRLGLEFTSDSPWTGTCYLDSVEW